jgi:hypothetical protein
MECLFSYPGSFGEISPACRDEILRRFQRKVRRRSITRYSPDHQGWRQTTGCLWTEITNLDSEFFDDVLPPSRLGQPSFFGNSGDTPWTVADFDATQFFARFYIDN